MISGKNFRMDIRERCTYCRQGQQQLLGGLLYGNYNITGTASGQKPQKRVGTIIPTQVLLFFTALMLGSSLHYS